MLTKYGRAEARAGLTSTGVLLRYPYYFEPVVLLFGFGEQFKF